MVYTMCHLLRRHLVCLLARGPTRAPLVRTVTTISINPQVTHLTATVYSTWKLFKRYAFFPPPTTPLPSFSHFRLYVRIGRDEMRPPKTRVIIIDFALLFISFCDYISRFGICRYQTSPTSSVCPYSETHTHTKCRCFLGRRAVGVWR